MSEQNSLEGVIEYRLNELEKKANKPDKPFYQNPAIVISLISLVVTLGVNAFNIMQKVVENEASRSKSKKEVMKAQISNCYELISQLYKINNDLTLINKQGADPSLMSLGLNQRSFLITTLNATVMDSLKENTPAEISNMLGTLLYTTGYPNEAVTQFRRAFRRTSSQLIRNEAAYCLGEAYCNRNFKDFNLDSADRYFTYNVIFANMQRDKARYEGLSSTYFRWGAAYYYSDLRKEGLNKLRKCNSYLDSLPKAHGLRNSLKLRISEIEQKEKDNSLDYSTPLFGRYRVQGLGNKIKGEATITTLNGAWFLSMNLNQDSKWTYQVSGMSSYATKTNFSFNLDGSESKLFKQPDGYRMVDVKGWAPIKSRVVLSQTRSGFKGTFAVLSQDDGYEITLTRIE